MNYLIKTPENTLYGPAPEETIHQWIREGRISPTMLIAEESPSPATAYAPIGDHPLFAPVFAAIAPARPVPLPMPTPTPAPAVPAQPLAYPDTVPYSGHAIAAFVLALTAYIACPLLPALIAIPLGFKALTCIREQNLAGAGLAKIALALAFLAIPLGLGCTAVAAWGLFIA